MDWNLSEEQKMLRQAARELAQKELVPRAAQVDREEAFPQEGIAKLAQAGFLGMLLPPSVGGGGANSLSFTVVTEEIARGCASTALIFITHLVSSLGLLLGGTDSAKGKYLPTLARGSLATLAATEADSGANPLAIQARAQPRGDGYLLNGAKVFITSGGQADLYLVVARTSDAPGPAGLGILAVDKDTPGLSLGKKDRRMGLNGTSPREIRFDDCRVPKENRVGEALGYMPLAMAIGGVGMLGAAAIALGLSQAALEATLHHARQRTVLGQPLGNYQGIQFLVSEMAAAVDAMRAQLYWAAWMRDNSPPPHLDAFKAKLLATEMALEVTHKALQVHGGTGYTKDLPLERHYRDARGLTLHFTPSEMLKETIGRFLLGLMP